MASAWGLGSLLQLIPGVKENQFWNGLADGINWVTNPVGNAAEAFNNNMAAFGANIASDLTGAGQRYTGDDFNGMNMLDRATGASTPYTRDMNARLLANPNIQASLEGIKAQDAKDSAPVQTDIIKPKPAELPAPGQEWADDTRRRSNELWNARTHEINKLNFERVKNPWEKDNPLYQQSVNRQVGDHAQAFANQQERMNQSAVMRNIQPGSGINVENERVARMANAGSLGRALNGIEQDRYQRYSAHEVDQANKANEFNRVSAQLKDAISRQDAGAYASLQEQLGRITGQQGDLQQQLQLQPGETANGLLGQQYEGMQLQGGIDQWKDPASAALRREAPSQALGAARFDATMKPWKDVVGMATDLGGTAANLWAMGSGMPPPLPQRKTGQAYGQPLPMPTMGNPGYTPPRPVPTIGSTTPIAGAGGFRPGGMRGY